MEVPTILLGDFNEPRRSGSLAGLRPHVEFGATPATFPSPCPLLRLDRIFVTPTLRATLRVQRDRRSRVASDHLPLLADVELAGHAARQGRTASTQPARITMRSGPDEEESAS